jgi:hypothetical protein
VTAVAYLISDKYKALTVDSVVKIDSAKETIFRFQNKIDLLENSNFAVTVVGNEVVLTAISILNSWYRWKGKAPKFTNFDFINDLTIASNYLKDAYNNSEVDIPNQGATLFFVSASDAFTWSIQQNTTGYFYSKQDRPVNLLNGRGAVVYGGIGPLYFNLPEKDTLLDSKSVHEFLRSKIEETHEDFRSRKMNGEKGFLDYEFEGFFSTVVFDSQTSNPKFIPPFEYLSDQVFGLLQGKKNNQIVLNKADESKWNPT